MRFSVFIIGIFFPLSALPQSVLVDGARSVYKNPAALGVLPGWEAEFTLLEFELQQYGSYVTLLSDLEELLAPGERFSNLTSDERTKASALLTTLSAQSSASHVSAQSFLALKLRNFGFGFSARSRGGADLRVDTQNLAPARLSSNQSFVDSATLSTFELKLAYSHSLLPNSEHSQVYAGAALRLLRGQTSAFHTPLQEIADPDRPVLPKLFASVSQGELKADLDLGVLYTYRRLFRAGVSVQGLVDPSFTIQQPANYQGPDSMSLGRQAVFGLGLTPGLGLRLGADLALNRHLSSLDTVRDRSWSLSIEKRLGADWSIQTALLQNQEATGNGLAGLFGVRWKGLKTTLLYSPRDGLLSEDQFGLSFAYSLNRITYPEGD